MIYLQIGGGAGDLDPSTNYRDGFSEFVKSKNDKDKKIFIVEANPANIRKLKRSWKNFKNVKIINIAITRNNVEKKMFYYSEKDAPHYQLFSSKKKHVMQHYPDSIIKKIELPCMGINLFLEKYLKNKSIDWFSIDIEGSDYEVMMSLNLNKYEIKNVSLEYLHLKKAQKKRIIEKLIKFGYSYYGFGLDHNKIDWLFKKKKSRWNNLIAKMFPHIHRIHYKRLNKILLK